MIVLQHRFRLLYCVEFHFFLLLFSFSFSFLSFLFSVLFCVRQKQYHQGEVVGVAPSEVYKNHFLLEGWRAEQQRWMKSTAGVHDGGERESEN